MRYKKKRAKNTININHIDSINKEWTITKKECALLYAYIFTLQSFNSICFDEEYGFVTKIIETKINERVDRNEAADIIVNLKKFLSWVSSTLIAPFLIKFILRKISNNEAIEFLNFLNSNNPAIFYCLTNNYFNCLTNNYFKRISKPIKMICDFCINLWLLPKPIV